MWSLKEASRGSEAEQGRGEENQILRTQVYPGSSQT